MAQFPNTVRGDDGKFIKADGRLPADVPVPGAVDPTEERGVGGTAVYGGVVEPGESSSQLVGVAKYRFFADAIANVAIIAAGLRLFLNLVSSAQWRASPPPDSGEAGLEMAQKVEDILGDMKTPWHRVIKRLATHKIYGYALSEWVAKRNDDGSIGFSNVLSLSQRTIERWMIDKDGSVLGAIQTSPQTGKNVAIPREKMIYVVDDALDGSPEGLGVLRHCADSIKRLQRLQELELWGYANDLRGIPVARAPIAELDLLVKNKTLSQADADAMLEGIDSFVQRHVRNPDMGLLIDSSVYRGSGDQRTPANTPMWSMDLLDGGHYSLEAVAAAIVRVQREIARVMGVEHLMLGENSAGSRQLSNDKTQSFGLLVDGALREIREAVERDLLGPLWELNGWDPALKPTLKTDAQAMARPTDLSAVLRDLAQAGVQVDRQDNAVQELMDMMGLSRLAPLSQIDTDLLLQDNNGLREDATTDPVPERGEPDRSADDGSGGSRV